MRSFTYWGPRLSLFSAILLIPVGPSFALWNDRAPSSFAPQQFNIISQPRIMDKHQILEDHKGRISKDFKIPSYLKKRVSFWFDIYTKYSAQEEVIHHAEYPWIVYRVVDLRPILFASGNRWTNYHKSIKLKKAKRLEIHKALSSLGKKKSYKSLSGLEKDLFEKLKEVPGNRQAVFKRAAQNIRTQVGQKDHVESGIRVSSQYLPQLESVFSRSNLPLELTRLPFVESSFNIKAVSKVGASGIWQVMPYIGKRFLLINDTIDERNSPIKSAKVAAHILKENRMILKNWPLALTAYNHGAGSLVRAVKATGSRNFEVILKKYRAKSFGFASQNFYASFLAILHAEKYKDEVFRYIDVLPFQPFSEVRLSKSIRIQKLLQLSQINQSEFSQFNLDIKSTAYKKNSLLPAGFVVHLPHASAMALESLAPRIASRAHKPTTSSKKRL